MRQKCTRTAAQCAADDHGFHLVLEDVHAYGTRRDLILPHGNAVASVLGVDKRPQSDYGQDHDAPNHKYV